VPARFIYKNAELGPAFLERLYGETDLTLSTDQRQMIDWLAQGQYSLIIFPYGAELSRAAEQGLPIAMVAGERLKEGVPIGPAAGAVNLMQPTPHPNAAKLYINWLLSREGQIAWQQATRENSLRVDIPKDGLLPFDPPKPGVTYVNGGTEEYAGVSGGMLAEVINRALEKRGR
jgi:ABC-type Fe3+ transport system substrate-binding protein